ncbi:MAG TPA: protein kinase [Kofleriaceae bacterium]|nr:protein kinase [Kofleriaceae bacterium]
MTDAISEHRETTRLGSFEILRRLARGGMAEIYLARTSGPSGFEKLVVLKKILGKLADKPRYVQLFLEEARLAASLDHPSIAQVYDIGMVDGSYFFAMEHLHGQDVRSILHRAWRIGDRLPIEHAVQIARHAASALHFAHEKRRSDGTLLGLVHRDVSPSNILVTYDGATKLLDFGVAKTAASSVKTRTGALKGKIAYMSPEQARGAPLDRRSDIFSLGIVLWEMVTTQRLYRADNDLATLQLIIHQPPRPPSQVRPECPPELERIVLRALAQDPDARYPAAEQLVLELDELAREHKLKQSPNALAATLGQLFGPELAAWREAQAAGVSLADHLQELADRTRPVSESEFIRLQDGLAGGAGFGEDDDELELEDELEGEPEGELEVEPEVEPEIEDVALDDARAISDAGDDDLTVHMAPVVDTLSPLAADPLVPEPTPLPATLITETLTLPGPPVALVPPRATPSAPLPPVRTSSTGPEPAIGGADGAPLAPLTAARSGSPLAAPPWQSGQPAPPPGDRVARSWRVIDLPAVDPALFERQRRIVLRIAIALIGVVIALAVLAGRC